MYSRGAKIYHQLKQFKNYNYVAAAGVFTVLGFVMPIGIPVFPKNLFVSVLFFVLAYMSNKHLKTTKPIILSRNSIALGKMVHGFKTTTIEAKSIESIDLVYMITKGTISRIGDEIDIHSNYYKLNLLDKSEIRFENQYDKKFQEDLEEWCENNHVRFNLEDIVNKESSEPDW